MKKSFVMLVALTSLAFADAMVDSEGNSYPTVKIGKQVWMAKNMKAQMDGSYCYDDNPKNCEKYGRLYTQKAARNVCPDGWRLPDVIDYNILLSNMGENSEQRGDMLRHKTWKRSSNKLGFSAEPGGMRLDGQYAVWGKSASFWAYGTMGDYTQLNVTEDGAFVGNIVESEFDGFLDDEDDKLAPETDEAFSVRCIQAADGGHQKLAPEDYPVAKIGSQLWMARNLETNVDGSFLVNENIPGVGRLYTWKAALRACPAGWRLPTVKDWEKLQKALPEDVSERVSLLTSLEHGGSDALGFAAHPEYSDFWLAEDADMGFGRVYNLGHFESYRKGYLLSVRCLKDDRDIVKAAQKRYENLGLSMMTDDRDGKMYLTTKVGDLEWMSENLNFESDGSYNLFDAVLRRDLYENNGDVYGRVYRAEDAGNVCPAGWRLPTTSDWEDLLKQIVSITGADGKNEKKRALESSAFPKGKNVGFNVMTDSKVRFANGKSGAGVRFWNATKDDGEDTYFDYESLSIKTNIYNGAYYQVRCVKGVEQDAANTAENTTETLDETNSFKDERDGTVYRIVKIGEKEWTAENMNFQTENSKCYDDKPGRCVKYGRLYKKSDLSKICPAGWHLPTKAEWDELDLLKGDETGRDLRSSQWGNGKNTTGFNALPAGYGTGSNYYDMDQKAIFWSPNVKKVGCEHSEMPVYEISSKKAGIVHVGDYEYNSVYYSARCIRGNLPPRNVKKKELYTPSEKLKDSRDGNVYKTVVIDGKTWLAENLKFKTSGSMCYDGKDDNCAKYGRLYSWETAKTACPAGWHLPSSKEWGEIETYIKGLNKCGDGPDEADLKAKSWDNGKDVLGLALLPAGEARGGSQYMGVIAKFWTSTHAYLSNSYQYSFDGNRLIRQDDFEDNFKSVRCVKD